MIQLVEYIGARRPLGIGERLRNRTKEHETRCAAPGPHRVVVQMTDGTIGRVWECEDFDVAYRRALELFQYYGTRLQETQTVGRIALTPACWWYETRDNATLEWRRVAV